MQTSLARPLSKPLIKRMFLKVLREFVEPRGKYNGHGWDYHAVVAMIPEYFRISTFSGSENLLAHRAVYELERDGFIQTDPSLLAGIPQLARVAAYGGGLPIKVDGAIVGAIGVSGGSVQNDIDCAEAGLAVIKK